jgi:hypothetical protein
MATERTASVPPRPRRSRLLGLLAHWGPTLVFNLAGPLLVYNYLVDHGFSKSARIMISSLLPLVELAAIYAFAHRIDDFGLFTLFTMALTLLSFLAFNSPKALLYKDSAVTGILGLTFFGSLALPRPLAFYMGRKFATDGTPAAFAWWDGLWQYSEFRRTNRVITIMWGTGLCLESAIRIVLIGVLSVRTMVGLSNVLIYTMVGIVASLTFWYGRRRQAEAERGAHGDVDQPQPTESGRHPAPGG